jgi:hypothetical protein
LLLATAWQCSSWLSSATFRVTYYLEEGIYSVEDLVNKADVDLQENEDWQEHHENIRGIQRVLFAFWVKNLANDNATAQFYLSKDCTFSTASAIRQGATLVVDGVSVPANDSLYVTAADSYRYLRNVDVLKGHLIDGQFCLYCIAENAPFEIQVPENAAFVIEFTYAVDWEF